MYPELQMGGCNPPRVAYDGHKARPATKITQEVRDYAKAKGVDETAALEDGLHAKAEEFKERGSAIFVEE